MSTRLGTATCSTHAADSNVSLIEKYPHRHTQMSFLTKCLGTPCQVKWARKINHHRNVTGLCIQKVQLLRGHSQDLCLSISPGSTCLEFDSFSRQFFPQSSKKDPGSPWGRILSCSSQSNSFNIQLNWVMPYAQPLTNYMVWGMDHADAFGPK